MSKIEAFDLPAFVVSLLDDLFADVERGKSQESDVKLQGHGEH